jgi:hypothetical protein
VAICVFRCYSAFFIAKSSSGVQSITPTKALAHLPQLQQFEA